jgi:DNA-directed RNA polymerase subunit RPC12/RpoP
MIVLEHKCPNCGGEITWNGQEGVMKCPYCGSEFDPQALRESDAALEGAPKDDFNWQPPIEREIDGVVTYSCPSCAGEITGDGNTAATFCPFCGNPAIITKTLSGMLKPDFVLPFKISKKQAEEALKKHCNGKPLLPKSFKLGNKVEKITGLYVPFWLFSARAEGFAHFNATRSHSWSDSRYIYTKTDHYRLLRNGGAAFRDVPVDGAKKIDDKYMESIEPFDYSSLVNFQTAYLSGFFADKYDVDAVQAQPHANERIIKTLDALFLDTISGYQGVNKVAGSTALSQSLIHYALMPVWFLNTKFKSKTYTFAMNGQTGKFVGDLPVSYGRFFAWLFGVFGAVSAVSAAVIALVCNL